MYYTSLMVERRLATSLAKAQRVWKRDGWRCQLCGSNDDLVVDHVIALSMGGNNDEANLQTLCATCNRKKAANERPPQERRRIVSIRLTDAGVTALDSLGLAWANAEGVRSEVMRSILREALNDPKIIERARKRFLGSHNRIAKGEEGSI
jgi:hypothetical protein